MDGGTSITLGAIEYLVAPEKSLPNNYCDLLLNELGQTSTHRQATAVYLANEVDHVGCLPALLHAIKNRSAHYPVAICAACRVDGERGAEAALLLLGMVPAHSVIRHNLVIFDAITAAKNPASIKRLEILGNEKPEYRVSCAFAIRVISEKLAGPIIQKWLADELDDGMRETLSSDRWDKREFSVDELLRAALAGQNPLAKGSLK